MAGVNHIPLEVGMGGLDLAGDVARGRHREEGHGRGHLLDLAHPPHRRPRQHLPPHHTHHTLLTYPAYSRANGTPYHRTTLTVRIPGRMPGDIGVPLYIGVPNRVTYPYSPHRTPHTVELQGYLAHKKQSPPL